VAALAYGLIVINRVGKKKEICRIFDTISTKIMEIKCKKNNKTIKIILKIIKLNPSCPYVIESRSNSA
jgi:hypothetical protein